jgi:ion channel-forming bestrophin family protein
MIIRKTITLFNVLAVSWYHILWLTLWGIVAVSIYQHTQLHWLSLPWLPVSLIGTAVAFYIGFKNNASYDRMWEARKIWGGIVNSSRAWATMIKNFVGKQFGNTTLSDAEISTIKQRLIYRHVAWIYQLRNQLLQPRPWEHSQHWITKNLAIRQTRRIDKHLGFLSIDDILKLFITEDEQKQLAGYKNAATQIIDEQSNELNQLHQSQLIDDFRHMELQKILNDFYEHQGKAERIKNFPFPRQYASISTYFIGLFIILMPFGMMDAFENIGEGMVWLTVPFVTIIGWVFIMMELVGDYSENPFEGLVNDLPTYTISQAIEADLMEMIGEKMKTPITKVVNNIQM